MRRKLDIPPPILEENKEEYLAELARIKQDGLVEEPSSQSQFDETTVKIEFENDFNETIERVASGALIVEILAHLILLLLLPLFAILVSF
tara:strand:- start:32 stop:301 length:270 start_codon:yes stop_codon:yes gene_type:complete